MNKLWSVLFVTGILVSCTNNGNDNLDSGTPVVAILKSPTSDSCAEPYLFTDKDGKVYLSWIQKRGKESILMYSALENDKWAEPITIASGENWFVNWADYPVIATDNNHFIAHYLEKSDSAKFTYDVKLKSSSDRGVNWGNAVTLHDDGIKAEHGFVSIIPFNDQFFICWLDGRKTASETNGGGHSGHHGEMTLRAALIDKSGSKINEWELDNRVCDCCQTSAAITADGPVVIYRDRSDDEVRDMSIVRYAKGNWSKPATIHGDNWQIKACPVNGPRAEAIGNNLAIVWFSMVDEKGQVNVIFSQDGGASFEKPIRIDDGKPIGRVDIVMLDSATAAVSWLEGSSIKAVRVHSDGKKDLPIMIASSSESRSSGFPQMTKSGKDLIFAWTDDKEKTVKVGLVKL